MCSDIQRQMKWERNLKRGCSEKEGVAFKHKKTTAVLFFLSSAAS